MKIILIGSIIFLLVSIIYFSYLIYLIYYFLKIKKIKKENKNNKRHKVSFKKDINHHFIIRKENKNGNTYY